MLRFSELINLKKNDIKFEPTSITITVCKAKRRPKGFKAVDARGSIYCDFIESYLKKFVGQICFPTVKRGTTNVKMGTLQSGFKSVCSNLGEKSGTYTFQSCKIGGATLAAKKGLTGDYLVQLGHWRSQSMAIKYM